MLTRYRRARRVRATRQRGEGTCRLRDVIRDDWATGQACFSPVRNDVAQDPDAGTSRAAH